MTPPPFFNEKYDKIINEMQDYLMSENLQMINFTYTNGWKFKLSISKRNYDKLNK